MIPRSRISSIHDPRYRRLVARLVELREAAGLSQSGLAAILGMVQPDISKIERCERRLDVLEALDWLRAIKGDGDKILAEMWRISTGEAP